MLPISKSLCFLFSSSFIWGLGALNKPGQAHILLITFLPLTPKFLYEFALSWPSKLFHNALLWVNTVWNHLPFLISQAYVILCRISNEIVKWLVSSCLSFLSLIVLFMWNPSLTIPNKGVTMCSILQELPLNQP